MKIAVMDSMQNSRNIELNLEPDRCDVCGENKLAISFATKSNDHTYSWGVICLDCIDRYRKLVVLE